MTTRAEFAERRAQSKAELLRRVSAGERLTAACADPHMPNRVTVVRWGKADAGFAGDLAQAHRLGTWRRHQGFDEVRARAFLARFAAGESIVAICRDPAMPSRKQLAYWRATQGEFCGALYWLIRDQKADRNRGFPQTSPRPWDEALADRVLFHVGRGHSYRQLRRVDPSLPGASLIERWRRERPDFASDLRVNMAAGRYARVPTRMAAVLDTLRDAIVEGGSIRSLAGTRGLPCRATLYRWVRRSPDFARQIADACDHREDWYTDQMQMIADEVGILGVAEARRRMAPLVQQLGRLSQRPGMKGRG